MSQKIGMYSAVVNCLAILGFALSMLIGSNFGSYFSSLWIAFSFVPMICSYAYVSDKRAKLAGITAVCFASMYAVIISLVYFAQMTTVLTGGLTPQASKLLDFQQFGLFFNYDMLGYAFMSLATLFTGLTIDAISKADRWLKGLLLVHGLFFVSCLVCPILGVITAGGAAWVGVVMLEFWCAYFLPISILSYKHFKNHMD